VKENQGTRYEDVEDLFKGALEVHFRDTPHTYARTVNKGHARLELRRCWAISAPEFLAYLRRKDEWAKLHTVVMVRRERRLADQATVETAYSISSLPNDAARLLAAVRSHWSVENSLHWVLDIAFREDSSRVRKALATKTSPSYVRWLSTCSSRRQPPALASKPGVSRPVGMSVISFVF
jgi:predicted transposase YbfD/YdcC